MTISLWLKPVTELERLRVLSTAEMVSGFMELVALQIEVQPAGIQTSLESLYSRFVQFEQPWSASTWQSCEAWYADDLLRLLPSQPVESAAQKTTASPVA